MCLQTRHGSLELFFPVCFIFSSISDSLWNLSKFAVFPLSVSILNSLWSAACERDFSAVGGSQLKGALPCLMYSSSTPAFFSRRLPHELAVSTGTVCAPCHLSWKCQTLLHDFASTNSDQRFDIECEKNMTLETSQEGWYQLWLLELFHQLQRIQPLKSLILPIAMTQSHTALVPQRMPSRSMFTTASCPSAAKTAAVAAFSSASQNHQILELERTLVAFKFSFYLIRKFSLLSVPLSRLCYQFHLTPVGLRPTFGGAPGRGPQSLPSSEGSFLISVRDLKGTTGDCSTAQAFIRWLKNGEVGTMFTNQLLSSWGD